MKKNILKTLFLIFSYGAVTLSAQTAVNFNANDCAGKNHNLFTELDSGYVVVLVWVMPCGACVSPSLTTYNVVRSYDSMYPGKIRYYLVDDYANTSCPSLQSWANTYNMNKAVTFSNAAIKMSDYGTDGMPKIVAIGGKDHGVLFNKNSYVNIQELKTALDLAIQRSLGTGLPQQKSIEIRPAQNPVQKELRIRFPEDFRGMVQIKIYDISGRLVMHFNKEQVYDGSSRSINVESLAKGMYSVQVISAAKSNPLLILKL